MNNRTASGAANRAVFCGQIINIFLCRMDADELRKTFLDFFSERGHIAVPSSPLIPDDPSVLFTTAGMQQFKPYYTGDLDALTAIHAGLERPLGSRRAVSVQKCVRTSDIEEIGDATHLTFFEMLGNFSFGGGASERTPSHSAPSLSTVRSSAEVHSKPSRRSNRSWLRGEVARSIPLRATLSKAEWVEGSKPYFKEEAILWAKEFVLDKLQLSPEKLWYTVFGGDGQVPADEESAAVLHDLGVVKEQISGFGRHDNFWGPTGDEGPCGPTVEFHYDLSGIPCDRGYACQPNCPCGRFIEIWNLVFNEYYGRKDGMLEKLKNSGVDTGAGLERMLLVLEGRGSVFETSVFKPIIRAILKSGGLARSPALDAFEQLWSPGAGMVRMIEEHARQAELVRQTRIAADHLRASAFLIADGIEPSNLERGYVLRRIIRRAVRAARQAELAEAWWENGLAEFQAVFSGIYPEVRRGNIAEIIGREIEKFARTLDRGLREFEKITASLSAGTILSGAVVFDLYETYGFPIELTQELAHERGLMADQQGFEEAKRKHQEISKAGLEKKFGGHGLILDTGELKAATEEELKKATRLHTATHLLQAALRVVLGPEVKQMGSDITAERLRFDFTFPRKLTIEELEAAEMIVNEKIREDLPVTMQEMTFGEAVKNGALAFFRAKYPSTVHVYSVGDPTAGKKGVFSKEVCGGPHVTHTGEVGKFRILKEEATAAGIRRIRAVVK